MRAPDRSPDGYWIDAPAMPTTTPLPGTLIVTERHVVATLLGPNGAPLRQMLDRPAIVFGFARGSST